MQCTQSAKPRQAKLERTTFSTSRLSDFCSKKELTAQTGHDPEEWPLVIVKELLDNSLDACEAAGVAPKIAVAVDKKGITISDNAPGIPAETIQSILDYSIRVSSCEAYVSPTRGAQGNALKTILAMPFALDGDTGRVDISSRGQRHEITFAVDIAHRPAVTCESLPDEKVKTGTFVKVWWPDSASEILEDAKARFLQIADAYTWLNPHLTLCLRWGDIPVQGRTDATATDWRKWLPSEPTSPHWYRQEEFERLVAAYIAHDRDRGADRLVRELVKEFRGLTASAKQKTVLDETGLSRTNLSSLVNGDGLKHDTLTTLLAAIQKQSTPVKPAQLGIIGEAHIRARVEQAGCDPATFRYKKLAVVGDDGLPMVVEAAFAMMQGDDAGQARRLITGVNWSPGIVNPFRSLGDGSEWNDGLGALLQDRRAGSDEPVVFLLHVAHPRVRYTDRGKSAVAMASMDGDAIVKAVEAVTAEWAKQRKREERDYRAAMNRRHAFARATKVSVKEAAWQVMAEAYHAASASGTLPAKGRQIYYRARGPILAITGKTDLDAQYFEQTLLPEYHRENTDETADWDVVYDARGAFYEPHTSKSVPLGTLEVRKYLVDVTGRCVGGVRDWLPIDFGGDQTCGPRESFGALLYIEKQGFDELFRKVRLAERYDIGILSAKGQSVTACRHLADELCGTYGIPLLVLHDFDLPGFNILHTLRNDTLRYQFKHQFEVVDLGLRLADAQEWGLESERVCYGRKKNGEPRDPRRRLEIVEATEEEAKFLCSELTGAGWCGQRIELNAFTSDKLVEWIEAKLTAAGVKKIVPEQETLETAYRRALQGALIRERLDTIVKETGDQARRAKVPGNLERLVRKAFKADAARSWVDAVSTAAKATCKNHDPDKGQIHLAESTPPIPPNLTIARPIVATKSQLPTAAMVALTDRLHAERPDLFEKIKAGNMTLTAARREMRQQKRSASKRPARPRTLEDLGITENQAKRKRRKGPGKQAESTPRRSPNLTKRQRPGGRRKRP